MSVFKIGTYNVNSIRSRLHILIPWLEENRPDVLCMQETKVDDAQFPVSDFSKIGYHAAFKGEKQYNGVAVLSLKEPDDVSCGLADDGPLDETRLIRVDFPGICIINTYVPQGRDRDALQYLYKLEWFKRFRRYLERFLAPDGPVIWVGDLNVAPESMDVHDPKRLLGHVCFTQEVRDAFADVKSWGFEDIFRRHHPGEGGQYSFFDYRVPRSVERGLGWRVDHILATAPLAARSLDCRIDIRPRLTERPSDHTIVTATFNLS